METEVTPLSESKSVLPAEVKLKNSFALIILLSGLFVGSLFLDIGQLITGSGFSGSALKEQTVLESKDKTWVAYTEPAIHVNVVNDENCLECDPSEALLWMRRIMPTLSARKVAYDSFEGKELIIKHGINALPAFVFKSEVETTDFYAEAGPLFTKTGDNLFFDMNKIGLPVGKYLQAPEYQEGDISLGNPEASVTVTLFSDFACDYCREHFTTLQSVLSEFGDRVRFVFKHFPLPTHPQAETAALAASCAEAQGSFLPYASLLFERQADWAERNDSTQTLKNYAWRVKGLKGRDFAQCLDEKRFQNVVVANSELASKYNLQAAPVTFVGTEYVSGAAPKEVLSELIKKALGETTE